MRLIYAPNFSGSLGWYHEILVEKIFKPDEELKHPVCLKGKRSAPPEDCGGVGGYYHLLEALRDTGHPDHKDLLEWAGDEYDPEHFDVDEVNERLKKIR
jgi:hypothetical protein